jgi:hypothetical protein
MGRLIVSTQVTIDGVIDVGGWYVADGEHDRAGKDQLVHASAVLLGRKTYEGLAAYWSPLKDDWANLINPKPKYVASRTLHGPLEWNATLLEGDAADAVSRLKAELPLAAMVSAASKGSLLEDAGCVANCTLDATGKGSEHRHGGDRDYAQHDGVLRHRLTLLVREARLNSCQH